MSMLIRDLSSIFFLTSSSSRGKWEHEVAGEGLGVIGEELVSEEAALDKERMLW